MQFIQTPSFVHKNVKDQSAKVLVQCECGRSYQMENFYYCSMCFKPTCYYCCEKKIAVQICTHCSENFPNDSDKMKLSCFRCFKCPVCSNKLIQKSHTSIDMQPSNYFTFYCSYCFWDSSEIKLCGETQEKLLSCRKELAKQHDVPKNEFKLLQDLYKETLTGEKSAVELNQRLKRKSISINRATMFGQKAAKMHFTFGDAEEKNKKMSEIINSWKLSFNANRLNYPLFATPIYPINTSACTPRIKALFVEEEKIDDIIKRFSSPLDSSRTNENHFPIQFDLKTLSNKSCRKCQTSLVEVKAMAQSFSFNKTSLLIDNCVTLRIKSAAMIESETKAKMEISIANYTKNNYEVLFENPVPIDDPDTSYEITSKEAIKLISIENLSIEQAKPKKEIIEIIAIGKKKIELLQFQLKMSIRKYDFEFLLPVEANHIFIYTIKCAMQLFHKQYSRSQSAIDQSTTKIQNKQIILFSIQNKQQSFMNLKQFLLFFNNLNAMAFI